MLNDVKEFSDKFGLKALPAPGFLSDEDMKKRLDFQFEELLETAHAAGFFFDSTKMEFIRSQAMPRNLAEVLDGLVDQVYVALGTAHLMGLGYKIGDEEPGSAYEYPPFKRAWGRVHQANMKKEIVPGMWKIQKPDGWVRPDLSDLVGE